MADIIVITHNTWLIPFGAPWMLGRVDRIAKRQCATVQRLSAEVAQGALVVIAMQELWAFRTGLAWPLLWLMSRLQAALLSARLVQGGHEPLPMRVISGIVLALGALFCWLPLPLGLWSPKPRVAAALAAAGVPCAVGLGHASLNPLLGGGRGRVCPPALMDSGLLLCASQEADAWGFEPYGAAGPPEVFVNKGVLWARYGHLAVMNTHMTAERKLSEIGPQRAKLVELAARLLSLPDVEHVLLAGDLNHWQAAELPPGAPHVDALLEALASGPGGGSGGALPAAPSPFEATRLSCDDATNYSNSSGLPQCIDHVVWIRRRGSTGPKLHVAAAQVLDDRPRDVSDHNIMYVAIQEMGTV